MANKVELEAKIKGLEFIIEHFQERVNSVITVTKEREARGCVLTDFENGMRYQAEYLQKSISGIIDSGVMLEKDLIRIHELK
jgi:hypothetical protein